MNGRPRPNQKSKIKNQKLIPDRGHLLTEQRNPASQNLDTLSVTDTLRLINDEDATIAGVVRRAIPDTARLVETIVKAFRRGGRLIYLGAGTSGRLGVLDASECPPTFHVRPGVVIGIIAGGDAALRKSSEGREDDPDGAREELERLNVSRRDVVIGIAAGGTTPYVLGALRLAKRRGAKTGLICCAEVKPRPADVVILLPVGPEVLTGSTRMKAGTATKLVLNMISTTAMVQMGKAWGNLMVDLRATNAKLRDRAARIITSQCDVSRTDALHLLDAAGGRVKLALVMAKHGTDPVRSQHMLARHGGKLRAAIGAPKWRPSSLEIPKAAIPFHAKVRVRTSDPARRKIDGCLGYVGGITEQPLDDGRFGYGVFIYDLSEVWMCRESELELLIRA